MLMSYRFVVILQVLSILAGFGVAQDPSVQLTPEQQALLAQQTQQAQQDVPLPTPAAGGRNPSGVNMTELSQIQGEMDERVKTLEDKATDLATGLDTIEQQSPKNLFQGVDLDAEIIDPKEVGKQLEAYKKAQQDKMPASSRQSKAAAQAFVGELTPPIIILEPSGPDPLQKYLLMKLLTCKQITNRIQEKKQAISKAQENLGVRSERKEEVLEE